MNRKSIPITTQRRLFAESIGKCMNPDCQTPLFRNNGDIIEQAHIVSYADTEDNSFENLIILCPNCHTDFDKNGAFEIETLRQWKKQRQKETEQFFAKKYSSFEELQSAANPILYENKTIYEQYFLSGNKQLWEKFEPTIIINNAKLKHLLQNNLSLFQSNQEESYSNRAYVQLFLQHIAEFEQTRGDTEKCRKVLFPKKINSIFGIAPVAEDFFPSVESLECLIGILIQNNSFTDIQLGLENPFIEYTANGKRTKLYLNDTPRLRQLYYNYHCFRKPNVRLDSLNNALKKMRVKGIRFCFPQKNCIRKIIANGKTILFIYEYCLSKINLFDLDLDEGTIIVNLHNWNGESCISQEAYAYAEVIGVTLLTIEKYYEYLIKLANF